MALFQGRFKSRRTQAEFAAAGGEMERLAAKASKAGPLVYLRSNGAPVWTARDYAALAREGFVRNVIAFRAVRMVAEAAASVPWTASENGARLDAHPLLAVLKNPNERQSCGELVEALVCNLMIAGNAYIEGVALDGELRELYALRPDRVKVVPGEDGWPQAYDYAVAGRTIRFEQMRERMPPACICRSIIRSTIITASRLWKLRRWRSTSTIPRAPGTRRFSTMRRVLPVRSSIRAARAI